MKAMNDNMLTDIVATKSGKSNNSAAKALMIPRTVTHEIRVLHDEPLDPLAILSVH
jgi:hypothetical protein